MNNNQQEPLVFFYNKYGINLIEIDRIITGKKNTAIMLKNGNIGVCANFGYEISTNKDEIRKPDLNNIKHRVLLNAYYNAKLNYDNVFKERTDILDLIDFIKYNNIVMIGFFIPIVKKLKDNNIPLSIFDLLVNSKELTPLSKKDEFVSKADAIILTSTTIFNKTLIDLINKSNKADIFMLGPSSIMHSDIFAYKNIKMVFGTVFNKYDNRVLDLIEKGAGTRKFLKLGKKVCLSARSYGV